MDAISTIGLRVAQIQSLVADPAAAALPASAASASSGSSGSSSASEAGFAAALAQALAAGGTTSTDGTSSLLGGLSGSSGTGLTDLSALGLPGLSTAGGSGGTGGTAALLAALGLSGPSGPSGPTATTRGTTSVGLVDSSGVPAELAGYGNGRIPAAALAPVGTTGARMWQPAAQALTGLIAAARAEGVTVGVTEGYRPYDEQVALAKSKGLYSQGGLAAQPGTSEHGWGMAADLRLDPTAQAWMRANAARFGFVADVPRESWHWAYRPSGV